MWSARSRPTRVRHSARVPQSLVIVAPSAFSFPRCWPCSQRPISRSANEELHTDKPDEHAALLAHHWDLGGEAAPAARWHRRAAQWIAGGNSAEARRHWNRVRELADQVSDAALALELGQQSRLMILEYGWRLGVSEAEADELLREGEVWARRNNDPRSLAALYNAFAIPCAFSLGNPRRAGELGVV